MPWEYAKDYIAQMAAPQMKVCRESVRPWWREPPRRQTLQKVGFVNVAPLHVKCDFQGPFQHC